MRARFVLSAGLAVLAASCNCGTKGAKTSCTSDGDCAAGQVCSSGFCVTADAGPGGGNDGGGGGTDAGCVNLQCQQVGCFNGGTTTVTGAVYDPSGQLPLYNALVYVPNGPVEPFTPGISCQVCGAFATGQPLVTALTGPDGTFTLTNVPAGANIPLVLQIGRWRRQVTLPQVTACTTTALSDIDLQRLPRNRSEGDIPLMAIATGSADPFECVLRKIGISDSEFTAPGPDAGRIHYYQANGSTLATGTPDASVLWSDVNTLDQYDVVLLPCEGGEYRKPAAATQNIIDYTADGGRVFATHYSYVWTAFAQQPFPSTAQWVPDPNQNSNPPDPYDVTVDESFPKGVAFAQWLSDVGASTTPGDVTLHQGRHNVWTVNPPTQSWMLGTIDGGPAVPHLTFNTPVDPPPLPDGDAGIQCGRVVFSDFHVNVDVPGDGGFFPGTCEGGPLTAQEKVLVFMLFDLSSCIQSDQTSPNICHGIGQGCGGAQSCCQGLLCLDGDGQACETLDGGAGCSCQPQLP